MSEELWCIICVSSVKKNLTIIEAEQMLAYAKQERKLNNISSLVLYSNKNILILLEGKYADVHNEYKVITAHTGHHGIIKVYDKTIEERLFGDYPIIFRSLSKELQPLDDFKEPELLDYFNEFLNLNYPVSRIVKDFVKNNA